MRDSNEIALKKISNARSRNGYALENYFYRSTLIYERELDRIIFKSWLYAGHVSEIPKTGDFLTLDIAEDSVIITRDKTGEVLAFANTCRHRGARICEEKHGHTRNFICPYHAWTYNLSGELIGARAMGDDFNKSEFGLRKIQLQLFEGLIFINCDDNAPGLDQVISKLKPAIKPYHLDNSKVACKKTYLIEANWKLSLENYLECYHCAPSHKHYAKSHSLKEEREKVEELNDAMKERAIQQLGMSREFVEPVTEQYQKSSSFGCDISYMRYALFDHYKTGSLDGKPVAPLMGDFKDYDGGAGDFQIGPVTFMLNYPDHCVIYRFLPGSIDQTELEMVWFVRSDAEEHRDYDLKRLTELWDLTTQEDKEIIVKNSRGVNSRFFEPGPFSPVFELLSNNFVQWYLETMD